MPRLPSPSASKNSLPQDRPKLLMGTNVLGIRGTRQHSMRSSLTDGSWSDADRLETLRSFGKQEAPSSLLYKPTTSKQVDSKVEDENQYEDVTSGGDNQTYLVVLSTGKPASLLKEQIEEVFVPEATVEVDLGVAGAPRVRTPSDDDDDENTTTSTRLINDLRPPGASGGPSEF